MAARYKDCNRDQRIFTGHYFNLVSVWDSVQFAAGIWIEIHLNGKVFSFEKCRGYDPESYQAVQEAFISLG